MPLENKRHCVNLRKKIVLQIMPLFVSVLLLTSFMGYSRSVKEKEDIFFTLYNASLNNNFDINFKDMYEKTNRRKKKNEQKQKRKKDRIKTV